MSRPSTAIRTWSCHYVDLLNPDPASILLSDIAIALSKLCRFNGHVQVEHYSVAEHSILVANYLGATGYTPYVQLLGLMHDAHEAYLGDITAPAKEAIRLLTPTPSGVEQIADRLDRAIAQRFDLDLTYDHGFGSEAIRSADMWAYEYERRELTTVDVDPTKRPLDVPKHLAAGPLGMSPPDAAEAFEIAARELLALSDTRSAYSEEF